MTRSSWWGPAAIGMLAGAILASSALPAVASPTLDMGPETMAVGAQALGAMDGPRHHFGFHSLLNQVATPPGQLARKMCVEHQTGSSRNPTVLIEVNQHAVPAHEQHGDRVLGPAPCPMR